MILFYAIVIVSINYYLNGLQKGFSVNSVMINKCKKYYKKSHKQKFDLYIIEHC